MLGKIKRKFFKNLNEKNLPDIYGTFWETEKIFQQNHVSRKGLIEQNDKKYFGRIMSNYFNNKNI